MSVSETKPPSYSEIIASLLHPLREPISLNILVDQILQLHPTKARKPRQAILQHIRDAQGELLVRTDPNTILPIAQAFQGVRFRIRLDREIVSTGLLEIESVFRSYLPRNFPLQRLEFVDQLGQSIPFETKSVTHRVESHFGTSNYIQQYIEIGQWLRAKKNVRKRSSLGYNFGLGERHLSNGARTCLSS